MTRDERDWLEYLLLVAQQKNQEEQDALADIRQYLDGIPLPEPQGDARAPE